MGSLGRLDPTVKAHTTLIRMISVPTPAASSSHRVRSVGSGDANSTSSRPVLRPRPSARCGADRPDEDQRRQRPGEGKRNTATHRHPAAAATHARWSGPFGATRESVDAKAGADRRCRNGESEQGVVARQRDRPGRLLARCGGRLAGRRLAEPRSRAPKLLTVRPDSRRLGGRRRAPTSAGWPGIATVRWPAAACSGRPPLPTGAPPLPPAAPPLPPAAPPPPSVAPSPLPGGTHS